MVGVCDCMRLFEPGIWFVDICSLNLGISVLMGVDRSRVLFSVLARG